MSAKRNRLSIVLLSWVWLRAERRTGLHSASLEEAGSSGGCESCGSGQAQMGRHPNPSVSCAVRRAPCPAWASLRPSKTASASCLGWEQGTTWGGQLEAWVEGISPQRQWSWSWAGGPGKNIILLVAPLCPPPVCGSAKILVIGYFWCSKQRWACREPWTFFWWTLKGFCFWM